MAQESTNIRINFVDQNNEPYPAKRVVISDGETKLEFQNVTVIQETIPTKSSLRVVWQSSEYDTMEQIPLSLNANNDYNFTFYCLNRAEVVQHSRPYLLFVEEGANPDLQWDWDESAKRLTAHIQSEEGKLVEVVSWVDVRLTDRPNSALMAAVSNASIDTWSVCLPPNVNINGSFGVAVGNLDFQFIAIEDSKQLAGIRKATYNEHIIDSFDKKPFQSVLTKIDGSIVESNIYWPQYAIDPGYYHIKAKGLPADFAELSLPLKVELDKVSLFELYPPKKSEFAPFTFALAGEYYHTRARVTSINHNEVERSISAFTNAEGDDQYSNGYFGAFILQSEQFVIRVVITNCEGIETELSINEDFITQEIDNYSICAVRIPLDSVKVKLSYE